MPTPRFNLKNKTDTDPLILYVQRIRGERFVYSTGLRCPVKYWDTKRGRVKSPHLYRPGAGINDVLSKIEEAWKGEEHMERVRDTFIVACRTGLRWSDWAKIRTENIRQVAGVYVLRVETEKTGETVDIPVHPDVQRILGELGGELPKYANPYFNRAIKDVCAAAGLSKAEKVSTHTARRTFCTTLFLAGVPTLAIARMSGHRTERAFLTYIRMSGEENAVQAGKHGFFGK